MSYRTIEYITRNIHTGALETYRQKLPVCEVCDKLFDPGVNHYMVTNDLWKEYGNGKDYMCVECFEKRLGRDLTEGDITNAPINGWLRYHFSKMKKYKKSECSFA